MEIRLKSAIWGFLTAIFLFLAGLGTEMGAGVAVMAAQQAPVMILQTASLLFLLTWMIAGWVAYLAYTPTGWTLWPGRKAK